jgi:hypothetical protein
MTQHTWTSVRTIGPDGSIIYDAAIAWDGSLSQAIGKALRPGDDHYPIATIANPIAVAIGHARWWARLTPGAVVDVRHFDE